MAKIEHKVKTNPLRFSSILDLNRFSILINPGINMSILALIISFFILSDYAAFFVFIFSTTFINSDSDTSKPPRCLAPSAVAYPTQFRQPGHFATGHFVGKTIDVTPPQSKRSSYATEPMSIKQIVVKIVNPMTPQIQRKLSFYGTAMAAT